MDQQPATSNQQPATSNQIINENYNKINILKLKSLFPEAFCEDQIDWEKLKLILGEENLAHHNERYQLNWAGKSEAYRTLQAPTSNTLIPCQAESVDFDGTNHLFIEAENLEALKILQKAYAGSVKMIYIDPPYNTGSDSFIYPDKFSETREEYARRVGDKDDEGYLKRDGVFQGAWRKNSKESGHYHSNWLSMMLPRLHLAKTLLHDDGVIFISIDDNEQAQLKLLCDEVFGAENFVADVIWKKKYGIQNDAKFFSTNHDFVLVYAKNILEYQQNLLPRTEEQDKRYTNRDNDPRGAWKAGDLSIGRTNEKDIYEIITPSGRKVLPQSGSCWRVSQEKFLELVSDNRIWFGEKGDNVPSIKRFLSEVKKGRTSSTIWEYTEVGHTDAANRDLKELMSGKQFFDYPKPVSLIKQALILGSNSCDLILDFFSGSGTTAHAVMQLNAEDDGNRRYICVQLPEETDEKSEARKASFDTIAEIAKERIRRAGRQICEQHPEKTVDTGFKVFKLAESHFKPRRPSENGSDGLEAQLAMFIDPVAEHVEPLNMAYELMLRLGLKLTCPLHVSDGVYWAEDEDTGKRTALLLTRADEALIDTVIAENPAKVVALDHLFDGNDALKSNTVLQMRDAGIVFECV
ncbi:site-specific DNA-methyltransferase [Neisseria weaveri]|uniref:site-specific DNA-methyltransferase (adenine-specific) n=1 Tax=Neisseria weaveri TaxID=28091 RepID=A0A448VQK6_9NEIS|nr:site-specific DNA-methyltransferase [Neisseria weaveri]VEJ52002.1 type iii restriction-modification system methyltransferase [Neisseria weaveri]